MKHEAIEDNRHLWFVYPLLGLAALAVAAAVLIPLSEWAFSARGFVTILGVFMLLKSVGLLRGKSRALVAALFYLGLWGVHGFAEEFIRQNVPPMLTQPLRSQPLVDRHSPQP